MKAIYKKSMKAIAWIVIGLILLVFGIICLIEVIIFGSLLLEEIFK